MRRWLTKLCAISILVLLFASPHLAARTHRTRGPATAIQPTDSTSPLVLLTRPGWARVESEGGKRRVRLRSNETLLGLQETRTGWVAGGVRREGEGSSVFLLSSAIPGGERLPAIVQTAALQLRPVVLVHDGRLTGAAWLEGGDLRSLAVRYAEWTGVEWGVARTVARPGPGSQTALVGTCLRDGQVMLAWSRFDGSDDEIFWSVREGSSWSTPARIGPDNHTPDITPVLAGSGRGATLVWGRMIDGEYRLLSSSFRSGRWRGEQTVSAPGSAFPTLVRSDERLVAVYRTAGRGPASAGWTLSELDVEARVARRARVEAPQDGRPVVSKMDATGPVLRWLRPHRTAAPRWELER